MVISIEDGLGRTPAKRTHTPYRESIVEGALVEVFVLRGACPHCGWAVEVTSPSGGAVCVGKQNEDGGCGWQSDDLPMLLPTLGFDFCQCGRTVDLRADQDLPTCITCERRMCRLCWLDCAECQVPVCVRCGTAGHDPRLMQRFCPQHKNSRTKRSSRQQNW